MLFVCVPAAADETVELRAAIDELKADVATLTKRVAELEPTVPPRPDDHFHKNYKFQTVWDHSPPATRMRIPDEVLAVKAELDKWWFAGDNIDRPFKAFVEIVPINPRHPQINNLSYDKPWEIWGFVETRRLSKQPLAKGSAQFSPRYNVELNTKDVSQYRAVPKDGSYVVLADFINNDQFRFMAAHGQINSFSFGADQLLKVSGGRNLSLCDDLTIEPARPAKNQPAQLRISNGLILEKNGKKYLRANGNLLIPLESHE
jgi:hypothetical protein